MLVRFCNAPQMSESSTKRSALSRLFLGNNDQRNKSMDEVENDCDKRHSTLNSDCRPSEVWVIPWCCFQCLDIMFWCISVKACS